MPGMRTLAPPLLAVLLALLGAVLTSGSRARRNVGVALGLASMLPAWLLPPEPAAVRGVLALVAFTWTMRIVDLRRGTWSLRDRLLHAFSVIDTRSLVGDRPRLDVAALGKTLAWSALALAAGLALAGASVLAGAPYWLARWGAGVVLVYAAVSALYGMLDLGYRSLGLVPPPLHVAPILARSVQEFWGVRWARPISVWLGETCFRPWARTRPMIGVLAAFAVSASFHAYAVWVSLGFIDGLAMAGWTFAYFVLQGGVMKLEREARVRLWLPWAGHAWTVFWMLALAPAFVEPIARGLGFAVAAGAGR